jgi:hypothetical protein
VVGSSNFFRFVPVVDTRSVVFTVFSAEFGAE